MTKSQANLERLMARAVKLASAGLGATYPNPCVGALVWRKGEVLGAARSGPTGGPHAEIRALRRAGAKARGATLVVTLEPCHHQGRTGPCTAAIMKAGIRRVAIGVRDPASHVDGKGIRALRRAGIEVVLGVGEQACRAVHEHYLHHVRTGRPFVTLKAGASLDASPPAGETAAGSPVKPPARTCIGCGRATMPSRSAHALRSSTTRGSTCGSFAGSTRCP